MVSKQDLCRQRQNVNSLSLKKNWEKRKKKLSENDAQRRMKKIVYSQNQQKKKLGNTKKNS